MIKFEKRDVYIKELWSMSWLDRYIYTVANQYCRIENIKVNPLRWSAYDILIAIAVFIIVLLIPFVSIHEAFKLKNKPMPESDDAMFKGGQDWRLTNKWVVKR